MTTEQLAQIRMSANDEFKAGYNRYLRRGAYVAMLIILLLFIFSPKYIPNPYRLRTSTFEIVDMPDAIELPPPPEDVPRPQAPIEAAPDDEVTDEVDIAESLFEDFEDIPMTSGDMGAGDGGEVFVASQEKPKMVKFVPPDYPEMARASQLEGTVMVKVLVGPDGSVMQAVVLQGVHPLLDAAAREAAMKCKFEPGKQRNIPVKVWMAIPFRFRLH